MKKILILLLLPLTITLGCKNNYITPSNTVSNYLSKYQNLDKKLLKELDLIISNDKEMNNTQKKEYKKLMEKQYQNLSYKIESEEIDNDTAIVNTEIEVLDYESTIKKSKKYFIENQEEFTNEHVDDKKIDKLDSFINYKLKQLKNTEEKTKYKMTFHLIKRKNMWMIENLTEEDYKKIHGLY